MVKTLGDLLDRAADILGTDREFRLRFTRASLVSYINQGCLLLRSAVGDDWFQVDVPYTANVGTYTWPLEMMNPIRVAYRDRGRDQGGVPQARPKAPSGREPRGQEE